MNNIQKTKSIIYSAMFLALGMILPLLTSQIKEIGDSLLPMHLVVMLCGIICGWDKGLVVGFILPFLRSIIFSVPNIYPNALWMSAELATYGFLIGFLYHKFFKNQIWWLYSCLVITMIAGRIVWGITKAFLLGLSGKTFTVSAFIVGGFLDAIPGIIIQLVLVPFIVLIIKRKDEKNETGRFSLRKG